MKPTIKVNFADFWAPFNKCDNYFYNLLSKRYNLEISDHPDFLLYSCYGEEHLKYNCYRIFYCAENQKVNWNTCDYAFTFDYPENNERLYRLPNWVGYDDPAKLLEKKIEENFLAQRSKFCNMVVSNPHPQKRLKFFEKLSKYKKVDSGGRVMNNIGGPVTNKREFIRQYKFTIAFENSSAPGYTTEKLFEPMLEMSIPLYWGNPEVGREFNTRSFFNLHDFESEEAMIERIIEVDKNDDLYLKILKEPWFVNNKMPEYLAEDAILNQFEKIFFSLNPQKPVAQTRNKWLHTIHRYFFHVEYWVNKVLKYRKSFR